MRPNTRSLIRILLVMLGGVMLFLAFFPVPPEEKPLQHEDPEPKIQSPGSSRYREVLGNGIRIRSGDPHSPILTVKSARIEKRRLGPLVMPAFNTLVLEQFELFFSTKDQQVFALPTEMNILLSASPDDVIDTTTWIREGDRLAFVESREELLRNLASNRKISGLRIHPLQISVVDEAQTFPILHATTASGQPDGTLRLKHCRFVDEDRQEHAVDEAFLRLKEPMTLITNHRHILIRDIIDAFR